MESPVILVVFAALLSFSKKVYTHDVQKVVAAVQKVSVIAQMATSAHHQSLENLASKNRRDSSPSSKTNYSLQYSLGPVSACSRPQISHCSFSSSITIPEYYARLNPKLLNSQTASTYSQLSSVLSGQCLNSIMTLVCQYAVIPRCQSGTKVNFVVPDFTESCYSAVAKCPRSDIFESTLCNNVEIAEALKKAEKLNGKTFSLTECRIPKIFWCKNLQPSPAWLAAEKEEYLGSQDFKSILDTLSGSDDECQDDVVQFMCSFPTCDFNHTTLIGHRDEAMCRKAFACASPNLQTALSKILNCDSFSGLNKPNPLYQKNRENPGDTHSSHGNGLTLGGRLAIAFGCTILVLVGIVVFIRNKNRAAMNLAAERFRKN